MTESSTTASTTEKVVTCANFTLATGAIISVHFSTGNTASAPTLNVNSTGAKSIYVGDSVCNGTTNVLKWSGNTVLTFMYDGTYWKYISSSCNVGHVLSHIPAATSCTSGRWFQVAHLTIPPGVWLIDCNALFPATNTTGTRQIFVTTATSGYNNVTTAPGSYGNITRDILQGINSAQYPQSHFPIEITEETTFRLEAYQGSGSAVNVTGRMFATRLR